MGRIEVSTGASVPSGRLANSGSSDLVGVPGVNLYSAATFVMSANRPSWWPMQVEDANGIDVTLVEFYITGASAGGKKIIPAIYNADAVWQPLARVWAGTERAADVTNTLYADTVSFHLPPGRYLTRLHSDGAPTLRSVLAARHYAMGIDPALGSAFILPADYGKVGQTYTNNPEDPGTPWTGYNYSGQPACCLFLRWTPTP